ncbi:MAG: M20 family metallopeptidase [Actinomycetes bacterium]
MADAVTLQSAERAVLEQISEDDVRELAVALVRQEGQNPPGGEAATVAELARACRGLGLDVSTTEVERGRANLSAVLPGGPGPGLLLLGHTDVVPVGEGWTVPPFSGTVRDGRLFGRGSADMKGGLAACVVAMAALRGTGVGLSGPVELAALVDEEESGKGIRSYVRTLSSAPFAGCVVAEPTDLQTVVAARGDSYVEVTVTGRAAHAGNPADGANAIYGAAAVTRELERWHDELRAAAHPLAGPATWSVGQISGGTGTSTVPAESTLVADRRLLPEEDHDQVLADVRERIDGLRLEERGLRADVRMTMEMPGFETPPDEPLVRVAQQAVRDAGGPDLPLAGWTAACDGGFVARDADVPVVVLGPGSVQTQAHRPDESVALDHLVVAARTYALCAIRMLGHHEQGLL